MRNTNSCKVYIARASIVLNVLLFLFYLISGIGQSRVVNRRYQVKTDLPSFAREGYYCEFRGTFCMPASKIQTQKTLQLCGPQSDIPGFRKFGEKIVERTLTEMLEYEAGGAVLELGAQHSFLDMNIFRGDLKESQIFTFQPDFQEFAKLEHKFRNTPRVHVFHSAIFAQKGDVPKFESGGSVSASYFRVNTTISSRKRKPSRESSIYTDKNNAPDNLLLSEALSHKLNKNQVDRKFLH